MSPGATVDTHCSDFSSRKKHVARNADSCQCPAGALSGSAEASELRPHSSWTSPSQCLSTMGVPGPGLFCSILNSSIAILCIGALHWMAETFSKRHHSLSCVLHSLSPPTHRCQIYVMVQELSITSLHVTDITLNKSLICLTLSWCLLPQDPKLTNILWENCFFTLARNDR